MAPAADKIVTVSQLNRMARLLLEGDLPPMWVAGEISNLARPASGHLYFTLKDEQAQVRCAMFRSANRHLGFTPANGTQVLVRGRISLYEPRGDYQLIAEAMEPAGEGLLRRRFEELKRRLADEGLFDEAHKQPLPVLPRCIGVVTSPSGAALRDILHILRRRFPLVPVIVYPCQVQGEPARFDIVAALTKAEARAECDVLIVARGGGSLEDLWAFNEEMVARAIHRCPIPIVTGVGHEIDFTIADLVADVRAPTPSGAAELVVPDQVQWRRRLADLEQQVTRCFARQLDQRRRHLAGLMKRVERCHPGYRLRQDAQFLDELRQRLAGAMRRRLRDETRRLSHALVRLRGRSPARHLEQSRARLEQVRWRLASGVRLVLGQHTGRLGIAAARLQAVSPLATLERGYAIVQDESGRVLRDATALSPGVRISARLASGRLWARVERTDEEIVGFPPAADPAAED